MYPYLTLLEIISILLTLFAGLVLFYLLVRFEQKVTFKETVKTFGLYEICSFFLYLVFPLSLLSRIANGNIAVSLSFLFFSATSFFIYQLITKRFLSFGLRKALVTFIILVFAIFPILGFSRAVFVRNISNAPIFAEERTEMQAEMTQYLKTYGPGGFLNSYAPTPPTQLSFNIIGIIEKGTLTWPMDYIQMIMLKIK